VSAQTAPIGAVQLDQLCIDAIRTLSMDAVRQAKCGHPAGTFMALAPLICTICHSVLRFDAQDPISPDRGRFTLSNGHASMLLRPALHLTKTLAVNAGCETLGQPEGARGQGIAPANHLLGEIGP
jgi:transketolase